MRDDNEMVIYFWGIIMRSITFIGRNLIKRFEGFSPVVYNCPAGYPTIGYGHVLASGEYFPEPINEEEGEILLKQDVRFAEAAVLRLVPVPLTDGQFDALVSFTYNLGAGALQRSGLRRKLLRKDYELAGDEFPRWVLAGGRRLSGLVSRRAAERERFCS